MGLFDRKQAVPVGLPGVVTQEKQADPQMTGMVLTGNRPKITEEDLAKASETLQKYKDGKEALERRVIGNEQWWRLQHWEELRRERQKKSGQVSPEPTSAWLFNSIANKHADAMDNFPEPVVLPRERSDEQSARALSQILPVALEYNDFEAEYSDGWYGKLKNGTTPYGIFWNGELYNGLGDVEIREIDLLKLFWEPGVTDIQDSRNLFIVELVDTDLLEAEYSKHKGKLGGSVIDVKQYLYDDAVDNSQKSVVVDWYYKRRNVDGRTLLHYVKFVNNVLLYASENDPEHADTGWYADGQYPVVMDVLFPEAGTPVGFGYVDICKDPQMYIDKLWANILENSDMGINRKWFANVNMDINEDELTDPKKKIVHCSGDVSDDRLKEIVTRPLDSIYVNVLQMKIEEMKDTSSNRDVNSGGAGSGVTAAAAIAALQEAGNKVSRDMIKGSYRAYAKICSMVVERMRQFYTEERTFRITNETGDYSFTAFSNAAIKPQLMEPYQGQQDYEPVYRLPVFDVKIMAQRKNPFSRMEQNERAKELYAAGFFAPEKAQEALMALDMMDFEGIDKIREKVREGQTLFNIVQQMSAQMDQMAAIIQAMTGRDMGMGGVQTGSSRAGAPDVKVSGNAVTDGVMEAQSPQTSYMQQMVSRSTPKVE